MAACRAARPSYVPSALGGLVLFGTALAEAANDNAPKWQQVCTEGTYLGHPKFPRIEWNQVVFQTLVDNLRKHPSYKKGADGYGCARVIPWDYEHINEIRRMNGDIPDEGLPAASWTYDLEVRQGPDGKQQLWALTEWLPKAREQITTGVYQGCSVCVSPKFIDPVSGNDQGPTLTSIAITNDPFIQGMAPLVATLEQWGTADSPLEVVVGIRQVLELDGGTPVEEVRSQICALLEAISGGTVPSYVDAPWVVNRIRKLLGLPLLASVQQILGGAIEALTLFETSQAGPTALTPPTETSTHMSAALIQGLSVILCCAAAEPAIMQAAKEAAKGAEKAEEAKSALGALEQLKALFGSSDTESLIAQATKTIADAKALEPAVAALAEVRNALKGNAEAEAAQEADAVTASLARGDAEFAKRIRPVVLAARTACITENGTVDATRLDKFRADYPLPEEQRALLTRRVVAGKDGVQLGGPVTGYATQPITQSASQSGAAATGNSEDVKKAVELLNSQPGRNAVEKADALLCSRSEAHKQSDLATRTRLAGAFVRTLMSEKLPPGFLP